MYPYPGQGDFAEAALVIAGALRSHKINTPEEAHAAWVVWGAAQSGLLPEAVPSDPSAAKLSHEQAAADLETAARAPQQAPKQSFPTDAVLSLILQLVWNYLQSRG